MNFIPKICLLKILKCSKTILI